MILHVVLFAPRPDLTREEEAALATSLERAAASIPSVRRVRVGRRVTHGQGYEAAMRVDYAYAAILEFDDLAGLQAYLDHPVHGDLGARFNASLAAALVYDYEIGDASAIRGWLAM